MAEEEDGTVTDITAKLVAVAEKICAKLEHPTASVTYLDQDELRAALTAYTASQGTRDDETVERVADRFDHALNVALVAEALLKGFWFSDEKQAVRAARAALSALPSDDGWLPIETAPKDGTRVLALFHADIYPRIRPQREDLEGWNGAQAVVRHPGTYELDGRTWDHGWNIAGPVGVGGLPDEWFAGWRPLPAPPAPAQEPR